MCVGWLGSMPAPLVVVAYARRTSAHGDSPKAPTLAEMHETSRQLGVGYELVIIGPGLMVTSTYLCAMLQRMHKHDAPLASRPSAELRVPRRPWRVV